MLGFFFGIFGIIVVACMPNLKEQAAREAFADSERRRLREQLRQERIKGEAFRRHASARLDAHDDVTGVDTRQMGLPAPSATPQLANDPLSALAQQTSAQNPGQGILQQRAQEGMPAVQGAAANAGIPPVQSEPAIWFYALGGQSNGPVPTSQVQILIRNTTILPTTLLWAEGFDDWVPAGDVLGFAEEFPA